MEDPMTTQEITIRVSKTVQEQQYEPLTAEVIIHETCPKKKYDERTAELLNQASVQVFNYLGNGDSVEKSADFEEGGEEGYEEGPNGEGYEAEEGSEEGFEEEQGEEGSEEDNGGEEGYEEGGEEGYEEESGEEGEDGFGDFFEDDPGPDEED